MGVALTEARSRRFRMFRPLAVILGFGLLLGAYGMALAHANLVRSEPAANAVLDSPPPELRLRFSEATEPAFSEVQLVDREGRPAQIVGQLRPDSADPTELSASLQPLPPGIYTVVWRATSAVDGHVTAGSFAFVVGRDQVPAGGLRPLVPGAGQPQASGPTMPGVAVRWLGYFAAALLVGGFAFYPLVLRPALAGDLATRTAKRRRLSRRVVPRARPTDEVPTLPGFSAGLLSLLAVGWALALLATLVGAVLQAASGAGVGVFAALGVPLQALLLGTRYGALFWARLALLVLVFAGLILGWRHTHIGKQSQRWWWAGLGASALLLLTTSLNSHAAADPTPILRIGADWLHLLAASLWVGGLVALSLTLRRGRALPGFGSAVTPGLVGRFSRVATVCVATLGLTGFYRALVEVADLGNLTDTAYGTALLVKLGLIVPLLELASLNLLLIRRRLDQAAALPEPEMATRPWRRRIRQTAGAEVLLVSAVLLATSVLTSFPPAREAFGSGLVVRGESAGVRAVLVVSPGEVGINSFDAYLRDSRGQPIEEAEKVSLIFTSLNMDMGETEAAAQSTGSGHYVVQGGYLSMSGGWRIQLLVRRSGQDDVRIDLTVQPRKPAVSATSGPGSSGFGAPALSSGVVLGLELVVAGLIPILGARRLGRARRWAGWVAVGGGLAVVALGAWVGATAFLAVRATPGGNPVPADAASLAQGREIYAANCAVCHGVSGRGDGPQAAGLRPRPPDFQLHLAGGGHSDGQLYDWISNGVAGSAMPAFKDRLSEQDRWDVISHIRTLATPAPAAAPASVAGPTSGRQTRLSDGRFLSVLSPRFSPVVDDDSLCRSSAAAGHSVGASPCGRRRPGSHLAR